jgi:putative DNA primase/helicase
MSTPTWDTFLDDITGVGDLPDPEMREYLQVYAGYAATGYTNEHIFFLLHGQGGNGKSTFVNTLMSVLGDYAGTVPGDMYCVTRKDMSHYKYMFHGRRLIVSTEFGQRAVWDLGELKRLTGGDTLSARNLYKDPFEFTPTHTVMIASNTKPKIEYIDQAIKRRTRLIPFDFTLAEERKDQKLDQKLEKEYPGILAWIIRGAMQWHQTGLPKTPLRVLRATDEYFGDNDLIGLWLNECVVCREGENAESGSVFKSWQLFLSRQKEVNTTNTQFIELLKLKGIFKIKIRGKHYYKDIILKNEEAEDDGKIIPFR